MNNSNLILATTQRTSLRPWRLIAAVMLLCLISSGHAAAPKITPDDLRRFQLNKEPGLIIIDVRPPDAYAAGHIQGARNIQAGNVASAGLPLTAHIVVYCSEPACSLSANAAKSLTSAGYEKVNLLEGGLADWLKHAYPATTGAPTAKSPKRAAMRTKDARKAINDGSAFALDVRPAVEFKAGHLPHAYNAPLETLESHYIDLPKNKKIVVYDRLIARSRQAFDTLKASNYDVYELPGGLAGWVKRNQPLEMK